MVIQTFIDRIPAASHAFSTPSPLPRPPGPPGLTPSPVNQYSVLTGGRSKGGRGLLGSLPALATASQKSTRSHLFLFYSGGHLFSSPLNSHRVKGLPLALHLHTHVRANPAIAGPANPWLMFPVPFFHPGFPPHAPSHPRHR